MVPMEVNLDMAVEYIQVRCFYAEVHDNVGSVHVPQFYSSFDVRSMFSRACVHRKVLHAKVDRCETDTRLSTLVLVLAVVRPQQADELVEVTPTKIRMTKNSQMAKSK